MSYKREVENVMDALKEDVSTILYELNSIAELDNVDDIKDALQDTISTVQTLLEEL